MLHIIRTPNENCAAISSHRDTSLFCWACDRHNWGGGGALRPFPSSRFPPQNDTTMVSSTDNKSSIILVIVATFAATVLFSRALRRHRDDCNGGTTAPSQPPSRGSDANGPSSSSSSSSSSSCYSSSFDVHDDGRDYAAIHPDARGAFDGRRPTRPKLG